MKHKINVDLWLGRIGLGLIFCYCLLASILYFYFAQIHLTLSFLPFPIFVGEITMFLCFPLLVWVSRDGRLFSPRAIFFLGLYFGWVGIRALINYHFDGPLTCRNAALFYYPIFAVFAYAFYQKAMVPPKVLIALAFLAAGILFFKVMNVWYWWTYATFVVIAVWNAKSAQWRWLGWIFMAVIILLGKEYFYKGPRAHFVSIFGAVVFLVSYFGALLAKRRNYTAVGILLISFLLFIFGFFVFSNHNALSSVTSLKELINTYNAFEERYQAQQNGYVPEKLSVQLYNPKKFKDFFPSSPSATTQPAATATVISQPATTAKKVPQVSPSVPVVSTAIPKPKGIVEALLSPFMPHWLKNIQSSHIREGRSLDLDETNIVFRLFVWRDMARELIDNHAWWGFSFGHPQRSRSLEVLHWAESEWGRDGWITPHNSYFHIIYRAGILGLFLIGALFFMIGRLTRDFFNMNSVEGGFLVGGLVYWLVLSNFFIILEFPYNAILIWSLFGITLAYRDGLKKQNEIFTK